MSGTIVERLRGKRRAHVDSNVIVYFLEKVPKYLPLVRSLFQMVDDEKLEACSSYVTLLEVLVKPLKDGRRDLADQYREVLVQSRGFTLRSLDRRIAESGAEIRARYGFRTPDAIQLATAQQEGADIFVTNDVKLRKFREVEFLFLDDLLEDPLRPEAPET